MRKHAIDFTNSLDMCEQNHKKECDINHIMRKFQKTGVVEHVKKHSGKYADVPSGDYREAQETITTANTMFEELPSRARAKFNNDPFQFLEYVQNPENLESLHKLGLLDPSYQPPQATQKPTEAQEGSTATSNSEGVSDAQASAEG